MKVGDLVKFRHLDPSWGEIGLITEITSTQTGPSMIVFMTPMLMKCTIPWSRRNTYVQEIISKEVTR